MGMEQNPEVEGIDIIRETRIYGQDKNGDYVPLRVNNDGEIEITLDGESITISGSVDTNVSDRSARTDSVQDPAGDISGGVTQDLQDNDSFTLFLNAAGAVDVTVEISPNDGTDWFTAAESPISFSGSGDDTVRFTYDANDIRLTGSNSTNVQALIREII